MRTVPAVLAVQPEPDRHQVASARALRATHQRSQARNRLYGKRAEANHVPRRDPFRWVPEHTGASRLRGRLVADCGLSRLRRPTNAQAARRARISGRLDQPARRQPSPSSRRHGTGNHRPSSRHTRWRPRRRRSPASRERAIADQSRTDSRCNARQDMARVERPRSPGSMPPTTFGPLVRQRLRPDVVGRSRADTDHAMQRLRQWPVRSSRAGPRDLATRGCALADFPRHLRVLRAGQPMVDR